ncbi:MAG: Zn-dependent hydrolase, partial [Erythrobacter sp.]|nr:Zn-dependent hydrolase [Erythrobacter sp.]
MAAALSHAILPPSGARAEARCREIGCGPFSDTPDGLYRGYLTPSFFAAQRQLRAWMEQAGMSVRLDQAANLIGRYEGSNPAAPALIIGSHLDSVRNGGCYDGPLGILLGIELIAVLHAEGRRFPFPIEVYAFGDEEGSRFPKAMLTSRAVAGTLSAEELAVCDAAGISLADAGVEVASFLAAARPRHELLAYLETHIEQGPVLEAEGLAVGTVTGIVAQRRYVIEVVGMAGHAGTVTMAHRRDALAGASEMVCAIERFALGDGGDLVATVGQLQAYPGAQNVIAGKVRFTLDVRS